MAITGDLITIGLYTPFTIRSPIRPPLMITKGNHANFGKTKFSKWRTDCFKVWFFYDRGREEE